MDLTHNSRLESTPGRVDNAAIFSNRTPQFQVNRQLAQLKRVDLFKAIADAGIMSENQCFERDMRESSLLDDGFRRPLQARWRDLMGMVKDPNSERLIRALLDLVNLAHGISNAASHLVGYVAKEVGDFVARRDPTVPAECRLDELREATRLFVLRKYHHMLAECGCDACLAVVEFDRRYVRGMPS